MGFQKEMKSGQQAEAMRVVAISDVHLTSQNEDLCQLFLVFLKHPLVEQSTHLLLLGDIFDVMVGNHQHYFQEYEKIFTQISQLLSKGVDIYYCEGNHDFHLGKLYTHFLDRFNPEIKSRFHLIRNGEIIVIAEKTFFVTHGDELEVDKKGHQRYRFLMNSWPMCFVANYLVPFWLVQKLGKMASSTSRELNRLQYQSNTFREEIKQKFRQYAWRKKLKFPQLDYLLCGHSHIKDCWQQGEFIYLNNGFFPLEKTFLYLTHQETQFIPL